MLGWGEPWGDHAVTFVIGNAHRISSSLLAPERPSRRPSPTSSPSVGDLYTSSLIALGLLLFIITFSVIAAAQPCCAGSSAGSRIAMNSAPSARQKTGHSSFCP